jgi:release factor glutamine methyltransferase
LVKVQATGNTGILKKDAMIKKILNKTYKPLVQRYLRSPHYYTYKRLKFLVMPGVFHPGIFFSSKYLLNYLLSFPLKDKKLLELGTGSGFIALQAAKAGAVVTATDISHTAIENARINSNLMQQEIKIVQSDLFENLPVETYDYIIINPPYFKKEPVKEADYAWYCGQNGEYFVRLFSELTKFLHKSSIVLMVLSEECDLEGIKILAANNKFAFTQVHQKRFLWELNFIFQMKVV